MPSLSQTWGTDARERALAFPCDGLIADPDGAFYRGVTINASPEVIFRWLCQMRVAPYSYDLIDNCGRQSPQTLTDGLEQLEIGQDLMGIFDLADFERNVHVTIRVRPNTRANRLFGDVAGSYLIEPKCGSCRLLVKLIVRYPSSLQGRLMRKALPWGDLIMMRRQLLNFKRLAEQTQRKL